MHFSVSQVKIGIVSFATSDYHMPRSYLLLKLMLLGNAPSV